MIFWLSGVVGSSGSSGNDFGGSNALKKETSKEYRWWLVVYTLYG